MKNKMMKKAEAEGVPDLFEFEVRWGGLEEDPPVQGEDKMHEIR